MLDIPWHILTSSVLFNQITHWNLECILSFWGCGRGHMVSCRRLVQVAVATRFSWFGRCRKGRLLTLLVWFTWRSTPSRTFIAWLTQNFLRKFHLQLFRLLWVWMEQFGNNSAHASAALHLPSQGEPWRTSVQWFEAPIVYTILRSSLILQLCHPGILWLIELMSIYDSEHLTFMIDSAVPLDSCKRWRKGDSNFRIWRWHPNRATICIWGVVGTLDISGLSLVSMKEAQRPWHVFLQGTTKETERVISYCDFKSWWYTI